MSDQEWDSPSPRCEATTARKKRCANPVFHSQPGDENWKPIEEWAASAGNHCHKHRSQQDSDGLAAFTEACDRLGWK